MNNKQSDFFLPSDLQQWKAIFQHCPIGIAACDINGVYIFANPAYAAIYGYEPPELAGKNFMQVKTDTTKQPVQTQLLANLLENKPDIEIFEKLDKRRDGTEILVRYKSEYLCSPDGNAYGALVFIQDVTTQKELHDRLDKLEAKIKANTKFETLGRIAGGVIHDFNNRLNVVLGTVSILQRQPDLDINEEEMLEDIVSAARQAAELTSKLLLFSRKSVVNPALFSLTDITESAISLAKRLTMQPIKWHIEENPSDTLIHADKISVQNAIFNILLNAAESISEEGDIYISYSKTELNNCIHTAVTIKDTGCGMSKEILSKVFDPLFSTKLSKKGTGLGLGATKQGVEDNGGTITINSELGLGTEVRITFPEPPENTIEKETICSFSENIDKRYSILIVDDEADVLKSTARMLESIGHKTKAFLNPAKAKEWYYHHYTDVDILLLDVMLPGMTGIDLMKELLAINPTTPVILMSGYALKESIKDATAPHTAAFIHKPFDISDLNQVLNFQIR